MAKALLVLDVRPNLCMPVSAATAFRTMMAAIAHCHIMGVMHRDIKVCPACEVLVTGLACCLSMSCWYGFVARCIRTPCHLMLTNASSVAMQPENFLLTDKTKDAKIQTTE